jgi:alkylhydroperoxidase/carboxymuconolactone decarboxylase family protein YurZ
LSGDVGERPASPKDKDEIAGMIAHLAFYGGWPVSVSAANVAKKVFEGGDSK